MMSVLLVSTYESGFQSLGTTVAAAHLSAASIPVEALDLSVNGCPPLATLQRHQFIGFHLPMFHSVPAAVRLAGRLRKEGHAPRIFFFGLYAELFRRELLAKHGNFVLGTDWEDQIIPLIKGGAEQDPSVVQLGHRGFHRPRSFRVPQRSILPHLDRYAKLIEPDGETVFVGTVETTRGCAHHCTHCPIPPVYGGKVNLVPQEVVLEDIDNLVRMGARHLSFIDPDFLNVPRHSLAIMTEVHRRYPFVSYDFVGKVSHFRRHEAYLRELARLGLSFVLTAMEFSHDGVLDVLEKKHNIADLDWSLALFRELRVHLKPTFVLVNPWVKLSDIMDLLEFIETRGLIRAVDPVQYKIRLLLFRGSPLIDQVGVVASLGAEGDYYTEWTHHDPVIEELHREICRGVDEAIARGEDEVEVFFAVKGRVSDRLPGYHSPFRDGPKWDRLNPCPRFNVPNYCCTEPTEGIEELKGLL